MLTANPPGIAVPIADPQPPPEARSGLDPWKEAELPVPPNPRGLQWVGVVGPGVIILGLALGSGEFLLGPAVFVRFGLTLLWATGVAILLQTFFNVELMRYTLATGEPASTGFMRTRPSSRFWAWVYSLLYFFQAGWPAWAATAATAIFFLFARRLAGPADAQTVYYIGVASFLICVLALLFGRRIERTREMLNWVLVAAILGTFLVLSVIFVPLGTWGAAVTGFFGYAPSTGSFVFLPQGVDFVLLGALVGFSGAGGMGNVTLTNWARDKGYGMSSRVGYIPAAVGGQKIHLAHTGFMFRPDAEAMTRWRGWWRIVRADQWGVFFCGAMLGMMLPALLYVSFLEPGEDIRGLGIAAQLAAGVGAVAGPLLAGAIAFLGAWMLLKTQLDALEAFTRAITDILWTGSARVRAWRGGDVRAVYYTMLVVISVWGMIALRLAPPTELLQISATMAAFILAVVPLHLLYVNTRFLPPEIRPSWWRRAMLVVMSLFYGFFVTLSLNRLLS